MQPFGRSRVRHRILTAFFNRSGLAVHVRELARQVGASAPTVSKELASLQAGGVLQSRSVGRSLEYRLLEGPITDATRTLFQRTVGVEALLRQALDPLPGIESAVIHGSYAGGSDRPDSDIDLIVVGGPDRIELADRLAAVEREVGRPVNLLLVDRAQLRARLTEPDVFWSSVIRNPRIRLIGEDLEAVNGSG